MKMHPIDRVIPPGWTVDRPPGEVIAGAQAVVVRNEYGREIVTIQDIPLSVAEWRRVAQHWVDSSVANGWMASLRNLTSAQSEGKEP